MKEKYILQVFHRFNKQANGGLGWIGGAFVANSKMYFQWIALETAQLW